MDTIDGQTLVPFIVQFLQEVPVASSESMIATGTSTGSSTTAGDNDKD